MGDMSRVNEMMKQMRIRTGGYVCPKCGELWNGSTNIHATIIRGFFGSTHPAWNCLKCGYTWRQK